MGNEDGAPVWEILARAIVQSGHIRGNGTIKPEAFLPPPDKRFSVTRVSGLEESAILERCREIAVERHKTLYGRADISVNGAVRAAGLDALIAEPPTNHAIIVGWGDDKETIKRAATFLAERARLIRYQA